MIKFAFQKILGEKTRTILTVSGVVISTIILLLAMFYLHVSDNVLEENYKLVTADQRINLSEVFISGVDYYDIEDVMVADVNPIRENTIQSFSSDPAVESMRVEYTIEKPIEVDIGDNHGFYLDRLIGVDTRFSTFSEALIDTIKVTNQNINVIIAGRDFTEGDNHAVLLSETTVKFLNHEPEDMINQTVSVYVNGDIICEAAVVGVYSHQLSSYYRQVLEEMPIYSEIPGVKDYAIDMLFTKDVVVETDHYNSSDITYPSGVYVTMKNMEDSIDFVKKTFNSYGLNCFSDYQAYFDSLQQQTQSRKVLLLIGIVVLVVSMLVVFNTLLINISEQKQFISLLKLLGCSRAKVRVVLTLQSLLYGIFGSFFGTLIGYPICLVSGLSLFERYGSYVYNTKIFLLPFSTVLFVVGATLLFCVLIGWAATLFTSSVEKTDY